MITCDNLIKIYKSSDIEVVALQGLDLTVETGELMGIIGNSGSGKSTLLNMLGGLDRPSAGKLIVDGKDLLKISDKDLVKYKRETVGFVWQNNARNLIPYLTALENIDIPMYLNNSYKKGRSLELLEMVGMSHRKNSKLQELSGGEQQRIAIAIALSNTPKLLLADEPTGAVDGKTANQILDLFNDLNRNINQTIVIVTHDRDLARKFNRVVSIRDGRTSSEFIRTKSYVEELIELSSMESSATVEATIEQYQQELIVVDKTGRLQIPSHYLEALKLKGGGKVQIELDGDKIVLLSPNINQNKF